MARLKPGEGYAERRARRKQSRRRSRRKQSPGVAGVGFGRLMMTAALLDAGKLPLQREVESC